MRVTASTIETLWQGKRVGSHARAHDVAEVIDPSHLRASDRHFHYWQAQNELAWAEQVGPATRQFLAQLLQKRRVKEQGYRAALSMKKLAAEYGLERLEAACARAIAIGAPSPGNLRSILASALDRQPLAVEEPAGESPSIS